MDVAGQQSFTTTATTRTHGSHTCTTFSLASFPSLSQETSSTLADPNSSELFKQNIQIAMEHAARVNTCTSSPEPKPTGTRGPTLSSDTTPTRQASIQHRHKISNPAPPTSAYLMPPFSNGLDRARSSHALTRRGAQAIRRWRVPAPCGRRTEHEPANRAGAHRGRDPRCSAVVRGAQTDAREQCRRCEPLGCTRELGTTKGVMSPVYLRA